jgi:hypothetical protein
VVVAEASIVVLCVGGRAAYLTALASASLSWLFALST